MFAGHNTMRSFMNQTSQRGIIHITSECLDCSTHTASDPSVGQWCWNVVICNLLPSHLRMHCMWLFRRSPADLVHLVCFLF